MFVLDNIAYRDRRPWAQAEAFLLGNPDKGIRNRAPTEMKRAFESGQGFLLTEDEAIRGVSLIHEFDTWPTGPLFLEIGTMLIIANGFGFQTFIAWFHLVQLHLQDYLLDHGVAPPPIFAVVGPGTVSEHNLTKWVRMKQWEPPASLQLTRTNKGLPFDPSKPVLSADRESIGGAFAGLSALHERGRIFRSPKGNGHVRVDMGWFSPNILKAYP